MQDKGTRWLIAPDVQCQGVTLGAMVNFSLSLSPKIGHPALGSLLFFFFY